MSTCENKFITKFWADLGATEHIANSKIIFDTFDESNYGAIKCANKNSSAVLKTEGARTVKMKLLMAIYLKLTEFFWQQHLNKIALLRKFADMGLCICLDNKKIDIISFLSKEIFCEASIDVHIG